MALENEPVRSSGIAGGAATGISILILQEPLTNILLESGANERLSKSIVQILVFLVPILIGWASAEWARRRTVPTALANSRIDQAFAMPAYTPQSHVDALKAGKSDEPVTDTGIKE